MHARQCLFCSIHSAVPSIAVWFGVLVIISTCLLCTGTWQEFQHRAAAAGDLDALMTAHESYLTQLLDKSLLNEDCAALAETLNSVLANMLGLAPLVSRLNEQVSPAC